MKKSILFSLILLGFSAMAGQIVLMRQLMVVFYGNELSLGITLLSWLSWTALGSWIGGRLAGHINQKLEVLVLGEIGLAFLLPLTLLAARLIPLWFNYLPGEIIGVLPMSVASFILLAPICALGGFLFVLGCEIYKFQSPDKSAPRGESSQKASQIGYVYILEAIGASIGGLITSLFLIRFFTPLYIVFSIGLLNLFAALLLSRQRKLLAIPTTVFIIIFIFLLFCGKVDLLRKQSLNLQWRDYTLLESKDSVYGNIAITKKDNLFSVFINGLYVFTVPDEFTSERDAHFPLLMHPNPKNILLIGGGSSGQLMEVLKHPIERVDYVELDPLLIALARKHLNSTEALDDQRVSVISNMDGRLFVKRAKEPYDVVIINLPAPNTAQLNRFYTREFFEEVKNALKKDGIFSFSLTSNPNYISEEQRQLYLTLKKTLDVVFKDVKISPGQTNYFLSAREKNTLSLDWRLLIERLNKRNIQTKYMREYYLFSELSQERIDSFQDRLVPSGVVAINRDLRPIGYYYNLVLWNTYFRYNLKRLFKAISAKRIYIAILFIYILLLWPLWLKTKKMRFPNWGIITCVGTTGFAEITFQIVTLLSFQIIYGYVYYKLGIILTSYMIGLIMGGLWITKRLSKGVSKLDKILFIKTQIAISIYPLILPILFWIFLDLKSKFSFWFGSNILFPFLPIIAGFIGGFQFPLANKLYLESSRMQVSRSAGLTYGIDLFGSCLGAILATIFLLPIIGIPLTCLLVAGLNLVGLILLLAYSPKTSAVKI